MGLNAKQRKKKFRKKEELKNNKEHKKLPQTFLQIFQYAYHLGFEEKPNYEYIFGVINKGLEKFKGESNYEKTLYGWQNSLLLNLYL